MGMSPSTPFPWVSVSPARLHPGPIMTVGALAPPGRSTGNQWARIWVPSNEVTFQSVGIPGTGVAFTSMLPAGGRHTGTERLVAPEVALGVEAPDAGPPDQPADITTVATTTTRNSIGRPLRTVTLAPAPLRCM